MNKQEDYTLYRVSEKIQSNPELLLLSTDTLTSECGLFMLKVIEKKAADDLSFSTTEQVNIKAVVINKDLKQLVELRAVGVPQQCSEALVAQFKQWLKLQQSELSQRQYSECSADQLVSESSELPSFGLSKLQRIVDDWISTVGVRYFSELTNLSNLIEEVGEVARLIGRHFGEQSFKKNEEPEDIMAEIADELADVLFVVICLANQMNIDFEQAMSRNMAKKTNRDKDRHINNRKL